MKVHSDNDYAPLKSVIVGTATKANFPDDLLYVFSMRNGGWTKTHPPIGRVKQYIIDETNEDLDILASTLEAEGIKVYRPLEIDYQSLNSQYGYCPRDNLLVIGDRVIEAPMSTAARQIEMQMFENIRREAIQDGARWFSAPIPKLRTSENLINRKFVLTEKEPVFDAANVARFGKDLLYLVSDTGNRAGAKWLQNMLGDEYNVHYTNVYNSAHIDSTIVPIQNGNVVLNANRVTDESLPEFLKGWNKIWIAEDMIEPQDFVGYPYASKWIAMNMLSLGDYRVICDKNQPKIIKELEKNGFTVIPLELRHARTLGGGFHCVTLDLERRI